MKIKGQQKLFEKAALSAFKAYLSEGTYSGQQAAAAAWKDAARFIEAKHEHEINRRVEILNNLQPVDALRKIIKLDGNGGGMIDCLFDIYMKEKDPLKAYAARSVIGYERSFGQLAIDRWYSSRKDTV